MRPTLLSLCLLVLVVGACSGACTSLRTPCEQTCYGQKSSEPRDFDDCIRRCQR